MKSTRKFGLLLAMSVILATSMASAQPAQNFEIAGGAGTDKGSVYSTIIETLGKTCKAGDMGLKERITGGGPDNLDLVKGNLVDSGIIPLDLLYAAKMQNPASVENIKVIVTLHQEAEHLIARADVKKEGGFAGMGGDKVTFNTPESLKGRPVGAAGGSVVTANTLNSIMGFGWVVKPYANNGVLVAALEKGEIDAIVISAGVGSPVVAGIKGNFKLLPLRGNETALKVYSSKRIEYRNLGGGASVDTLTAPAVLASRTFSSKKMLNRLAELRACFNDNVDEIKDTKGSHIAWQTMEPNADVKWPQHQLPASSANVAIEQPAEAAPAKPARKK